MNHLKYKLAAAAVLLGLFCPAGPAEAGTSATVKVTITVLPYAEVRMDQATLNVTIAEGATVYGPAYVGGTIVSNCPVLVFARIKPPAGAPGLWTADTQVARVANPGVFYFGQLLRVVVWDIPSGYGGGAFTLDVTGHSAATLSQVPTPNVGEVIVTVVPD
jgi:hypothetical protein